LSQDKTNREIAKLFASKFIARPDIKAIQRSNGEYNPVDSKFTMDDLLAHVEGRSTYGHYLLNTDSECKLFAFDIDLDKLDLKDGTPITDHYIPTSCENGVYGSWIVGNPREVWLDRSQRIARAYFKSQLRTVASMLARTIISQLEIPAAVAYSGSKGVHVYGFTGLMKAQDVREGAGIVLDELDRFEYTKGNNFVRHRRVDLESGLIDPEASFDGITIEVFPKQVTLDGKTHGNLLRLPLGRNLKNPKDPTFFLDLRSNFGEAAFTPRDPVEALTVADPF
jgi:hypothetical protein